MKSEFDWLLLFGLISACTDHDIYHQHQNRRMANVEQLLSSCLINIVIPDRVVDLPKREDLNVGNAWLSLVEDAGIREKAFFGALSSNLRYRIYN